MQKIDWIFKSSQLKEQNTPEHECHQNKRQLVSICVTKCSDLTKLGVCNETGRNLPFPRDIFPKFYVAHRIAGTNFTSQSGLSCILRQKIKT